MKLRIGFTSLTTLTAPTPLLPVALLFLLLPFLFLPNSTSASTTEIPITYNATTSGVTEENTSVSNIPAGGVANFSYKNVDIKNITIAVNSLVNNVRIFVRREYAAPPDISAKPSGVFYSYVNVTKTNITDAEIKNVTILFSVLKSWISSNNVDESTIILRKYVSGAWVVLDTAKIREDATYSYFESRPSSLSVFLISGDKIQTTTTITATTAPEATTTISSGGGEDDGGGGGGGGGPTIEPCFLNGICEDWETHETCPSDCPESGAEPEKEQILMTYTATYTDEEVYENQTILPRVNIKNDGLLDLTDINITVVGLPTESVVYSYAPNHIDLLTPGESQPIALAITPLVEGSYQYSIILTAKETNQTIPMSLYVKELTEEAKRILEQEKNETAKAEETKGMLNNIIKPLLIASGIIAPIVIAAYMILFVLVKRCPICGSKMKMEQQDESWIVYKCSKCGHFETKEKKPV